MLNIIVVFDNLRSKFTRIFARRLEIISRPCSFFWNVRNEGKWQVALEASKIDAFFPLVFLCICLAICLFFWMDGFSHTLWQSCFLRLTSNLKTRKKIGLRKIWQMIRSIRDTICLVNWSRKWKIAWHFFYFLQTRIFQWWCMTSFSFFFFLPNYYDYPYFVIITQWHQIPQFTAF